MLRQERALKNWDETGSFPWERFGFFYVRNV